MSEPRPELVELLELLRGVEGLLAWQAETKAELVAREPIHGLTPPPRQSSPVVPLPRPPRERPDLHGEAPRDRPPEAAARFVLEPPIREVEFPTGLSPEAALAHIRQVLGDCRRCKLAATRTNIVFGQGSPHPLVVFVGEGPGRHEDEQGVPFVGKAGELLDKIITNAMGLTRERVYICNVVKCRPPNNRDPEPDEVAACAPFLEAQIGALAPKAVVALGRVAAQNLLGTSTGLGRLRGRWHDYRGIPLRATFHPAYLLRYPDRKRDAWEDIKAVMARLGLRRPR